MAWSTPTLVEICIGLEINGYLPAEFWSAAFARFWKRRPVQHGGRRACGRGPKRASQSSPLLL